jgi:hypothetical protein
VRIWCVVTAILTAVSPGNEITITGTGFDPSATVDITQTLED